MSLHLRKELLSRRVSSDPCQDMLIRANQYPSIVDQLIPKPVLLGYLKVRAETPNIEANINIIAVLLERRSVRG